jgi:CRP/FNR family cyclic AMP-dependent transcriptional regulator
MHRATLVSNTPLFESLDADEVQALVQRLEERRFPAGSDVFRAGDPGATMFLIEEGGVDISTGDGKGKTSLASLFPGQFFGELSLLDGSPRSATATATKDCVLLALDRDDFLLFLKGKPDAAVKIMAELAERLRQTNALFSLQVSRDVLEEEEEGLSLGQRVADVVASFGGSWTFIGVFGLTMSVWMIANSLMAEGEAFDPFPFILLNLALSTTAALQAPIIMMSQNRQATKDKLLAQNDYLVNLKAELGIQQLLKNQTEMLARLALIERASVGKNAAERAALATYTAEKPAAEPASATSEKTS